MTILLLSKVLIALCCSQDFEENSIKLKELVRDAWRKIAIRKFQKVIICFVVLVLCVLTVPNW